jgi:hypothetical protein
MSQEHKKYYRLQAGWIKKFINGSKELLVVGDKLGTHTYTTKYVESMLEIA